MIINTTAEGITLAKKLETESAAFYQSLASQYPDHSDYFQSLSKENSKYIQQIERAYYGVITDALEGCFALNLDTENYNLNSRLAKGTSFKAALQQALEMENKIVQFYTDSAKQCESLMADVPRAFNLVAKKRNERINKLKSI